MNPVKFIQPSIPKNVKVISESTNLPNLKKATSELHNFVPRSLTDPNTVFVPEKAKKEMAAQTLEHIDFFA